MLNFVFILSIFLEIFVTYIIISKLIIFEKKINELHLQMLENAKVILIANQKFKKSISKINKVVSFVTNKKFITFRKILALSINIIEIILLLRSLDFSKGLKSINFKTIKKLLLTQTLRSFAKKIILNSF